MSGGSARRSTASTHGWTYDHIGWRDLIEGPWFDAVPTLTAAATVTTTLKLGTFVASPNFRHPVHFARGVTALDDISAGRLLLGIGAGGEGYDAAVLGAPPLSPKQRVDRFAEFLEVLDLLLREQRLTWHGEHYVAVDARATPGCVQMPRVPFVVAANGPRAIRLAARFGEGWVTTGGRRRRPDGWWRTVAENVRRFDDALDAAGRDAAQVDRYLSLDSAPVLLAVERGDVHRRGRPGNRVGLHRRDRALAKTIRVVRGRRVRTGRRRR